MTASGSLFLNMYIATSPDGFQTNAIAPGKGGEDDLRSPNGVRDHLFNLGVSENNYIIPPSPKPLPTDYILPCSLPCLTVPFDNAHPTNVSSRSMHAPSR